MASRAAVTAAHAGTLRAPKRNFASRVFGYDLFISFALGPPPRGTLSYASDLARRLRERDFTVFFSEDEAAPGAQLDSTLLKALYRSRTLVVVANRGTLQEPRWIRQEVETFRSTHPDRPIIPISVGGALQDATLAEQTRQWLAFDDKIWLDEPYDAVAQGIASDETIARLTMVPSGHSSNLKWRWVVRTIVAALVILTGTATWFGIYARRESKIAISKAREAQENANRAEEERQKAVTARTQADDNARKAQDSAKEAKKQRDAAEHQSRIANSQRLAVQAQTLLASDRDPQTALLLAAEALKITEAAGEVRTPAAEESIRAALARVGGIGLGPVAFKNSFFKSSRDGRWLAAKVDNRAIRLWDLRQPDAVSTRVISQDHDFGYLRFSDDSKWLISLEDREIRLWPVYSAAQNPQLFKNDATVSGVLTTSDGEWLFATHDTGTVTVWRFKDAVVQGSPITIPAHQGEITAAKVSGDGHFFVTGGADKTARIWDLRKADPWSSPIVLSGHTAAVSLIEVSNDGQRVITAGGDNVPRYWTIKSDNPVAVLLNKIEKEITWLQLSTDGRWMVSGGEWAYASLCDLNASDPAASYTILPSSGGPVGIAVFSPDSKLIVTATRAWTEELEGATVPEPIARVWDLSSGEPRPTHQLKGHTDVIWNMIFFIHGEFLATCSFDGTIRVWRVHGENLETPVFVLRADNGPAFRMVETLEGFATASTDGNGRLWRFTNESLTAAPIQMNTGNSSVLSMSGDGQWLFQGGRYLILWNLRPSDPSSSSEVLEWPSDLPQPVKAALSHDGRFLAVGFGEEKSKRLIVLDLSAGLHKFRIVPTSIALRDIVGFSVTDRWLIIEVQTGAGTEDLELWDLSAPTPTNRVSEFGTPASGLKTIAVRKNGRLLAMSNSDGSIHLVNLMSPRRNPVPSLSKDNGNVDELFFSPKDNWLIGYSKSDTNVKLWKVSGSSLASSALVLRGHKKSIQMISVSPDERWLVSGAFGEPFLLWDLQSDNFSRPLFALPGNASISMTATFSADGRWLATTSYEGGVHLWDLSLGEKLLSRPIDLQGHSGPLVRLAFSPDSHWLVTAGTTLEPGKDATKTCRIWDLKSPNLSDSSILLPKSGLPFGADRVDISLDGRWLITSSVDGVRLWPLGIQELIHLAERTAGRSFTEGEKKLYGLATIQ